MPVSPVVPNTVEVRLLWALAGQGAINVLHAIAPGGFAVNQTTTNTLGAAIKSAFTANLSTLMSPSIALARVGVRDLRSENNAEFLDTGAVIGGVTAGDTLPQSVALCITLRTAKAGKSFTGRTYLGGFLETQNDPNGTAALTASNAGVAFVNAVSTAMTASGLQLAVTSRAGERYTVVKTVFHNDGTTSSDTVRQGDVRAAQSTPVTIIQSRNAGWESQRRRANSRGSLPSTFSVRSQAIVGEQFAPTTDPPKSK